MEPITKTEFPPTERESKVDNKSRLAAIIESSDDAIFTKTLDGIITSWNRGAENLYGYTENEIVGRHVSILAPAQVAPEINEILRRVSAGIKIDHHETTRVRKDGKRLTVSISVSPVKNEQGKVIEAAIIARDMTVQREIQEALSANENRFRSLIENSSDAIAVVDQTGQINYASATVEKVLGFTSSELIGTNGFNLVYPPDIEIAQIGLQKVIDNPDEVSWFEVRARTKDGFYRWVEVVARNMSSDPLIRGVVVNFRDITYRRKLQDHQTAIYEASKILSSSLDYNTTLKGVSESAIRHMADWAAVDIVEDNQVKLLALSHKNPDMVQLAIDYRNKYPGPANVEQGQQRVTRTKKSELYRELSDDIYRDAIQDPEQLEHVLKLKMKSGIIVPIIQRDIVYGTISLISSDPSRLYDELDLGVAEELGRLAGKAIENSILYSSATKEIEVRKEAEVAMERSRRRYKSLVESLSSLVWTAGPDVAIITRQPLWEKFTGQSWEEYRGWGWLNAVHTDDREEITSTINNAIKNRTQYEISGRLWYFETQSYRYFEARGVPIMEEDGTISEWVGTVSDVHNQTLAEEHRRHAQSQVEYAFLHDSLTDLPNRVLFSEKLTAQVAKSRNPQTPLSIILLDLDRFKFINESLSHSIGDRLLQEVALRLASCIGDDDVLARLGGDEFGILLTGIKKEEEVPQMCQRILEALKPAFILDRHELFVTPSMGVSLYPLDGIDAATLMRNADAALYRAKEQGRNNFQFYAPTMNSKAFERLSLENMLRKALKNNEFRVYYQPQIDVETGKIVQVEALLRWMHPDLGITFPEEFIELAETTGLIEEIGEWVMQTTMIQLRDWHRLGFTSLHAAVNISARQFKQKHFVRVVHRLINESGVNPSFVELELTESAIIDNPERVRGILTELKKTGMRFAMDDFNTGHSSLKYIKTLPIDVLKIDRWGIKNIPLKDKDTAIVNSIINLAHSLNMTAVAEGVERTEQFEFLKQQRCNLVQGYLFSPPVEAHEVTNLLKNPPYKI